VESEINTAEAGSKSECIISSVSSTSDGNAVNMASDSNEVAKEETEQCPVNGEDAAIPIEMQKPFTRAKVQSVEDHKRKNCLRM
jgi:hypothetical protein